MMAQLPNPDPMIPVGFTADGSRKYKITGFYAELFDNLQVSDAILNEVTSNIFCCYPETANHCRVRWCFISVITYCLLLIWAIDRNILAWKCTRDLGERVSAGGHHATRIRPRSLKPSSLGAAGGW